MVEARRAHIDTGAAARKAARRQPGVLQRLPGDFEQKPLLRVHLGRLARRYLEKGGIEPVDVVQKAGGERVGLAGLAAPRMLEA